MTIIINSDALTYRRVGRLIGYTMDPGTVPNAKAKALPCALKDILNEFAAPDQVQFDPFLPEAPTMARANLPHSFPSQPHTINYLNLFLTDNLWKTITTNTNQYAAF
jgi:hypothetical protein